MGDLLFLVFMSPIIAGLVLQQVACSLIPIMMLGNNFHFSHRYTYCVWMCVVPPSGMGFFFMYIPLWVDVTCSYSHRFGFNSMLWDDVRCRISSFIFMLAFLIILFCPFCVHLPFHWDFSLHWLCFIGLLIAEYSFIKLVFLYAFLGELWIVPFLQVVVCLCLGFSLYTDLYLYFFFSCHSIHFLGHRHCNVVFHFRSLFMIVVSCYFVPTRLCITICLTRQWVCENVPLVYVCLVPLWQVSGSSLSALGLAGIVALSSSLFSVLSRHNQRDTAAYS